MPTPNLIHPIKITFELLDKDNSVQDPYAKEMVGQAVRIGESPDSGDRVIIQGQISFYFAGAKEDYPMFDRDGVTTDSVGYVAMRYKDMISEGLIEVDSTTGAFINEKIVRGVRVVQYGKITCDYYVTGFKPFAHYPRLAQTMKQYNFSDRRPGTQE